MNAKVSVFAVALLLIVTAPGRADDPIAEEIADAKKTYMKAMEEARKPILDHLDEAESKAREDANGDLVKALQKERKAFEGEGTIPKRILTINRNAKAEKTRKALIESHRRETEQAKKALLDVYKSLYKECLVAKNDAAADKIKAEMDELQRGRFRANGGADRAPADAITIAGSKFKVFSEEMSWSQAKAKCELMGGRLACVKNEAEDRAVNLLIEKANLDTAWLGATDERVEGNWVWVDGSPMKYSNWNRGDKQPNNKGVGEHYLMVIISRGRQWCDQPITAEKQWHPGFVCQWVSE